MNDSELNNFIELKFILEKNISFEDLSNIIYNNYENYYYNDKNLSNKFYSFYNLLLESNTDDKLKKNLNLIKRFIDYKLFYNCNHNWINDCIEYGLDNSKCIRYCNKCFINDPNY